ncbi:unnamed protein product [Arabidopsis halleri]
MRPPLQSGKPTMDICDWRTQLTPDSRQKIVKKIVGTLKKHLPCSGPAEAELNNIAARFENKIFSDAVNQTDYLRKISIKMLNLGTKSQNATGSSSSIPAMDTADWRSQLPPDSRKMIVNKILEILKKQPPFSGTEGINELRRIAARFEDNIFRGAVTQTDYLRKISAKIVTMENDSKNAAVSSSSFPYPNYGTYIHGFGYLFLDAENMENGNSEPCLVRGEPAVNTSDWRTELPQNSRQRNAYKM